MESRLVIQSRKQHAAGSLLPTRRVDSFHRPNVVRRYSKCLRFSFNTCLERNVFIRPRYVWVKATRIGELNKLWMHGGQGSPISVVTDAKR